MEIRRHTTIVAIRHGETEWTCKKKLQGRVDMELSQIGHKQGVAIANRLRSFQFEALYCSSLNRAVQTANYISQASKIDVCISDWLVELDYGSFEGYRREELSQQFPQEYKKWVDLGKRYQIPNGESIQSLYLRVTEGVKNINANHCGQTVVLVTHAGVIEVLLRTAMGLNVSPSRGFFIRTGSINVFHCQEDTWKLVTFGDVCHIDGEY